MDLPFALEGFFFEKVNGSTGQRVTFTFHYIIYASASHHTTARRLLLAQLQSLIRRLLLLHLNGISRWTSQLLLRGSFSKRSMGRRVNGSTGHFHFHYIIYDSRRRQAHATPLQKSTRGQRVDGSMGQQVNGSNGSTGQRVTFPFTILYMIADDARLTPPRCKKHTAYDDIRLTPHRCKKHTASFARSTGKFPIKIKYNSYKGTYLGCMGTSHLKQSTE